MGTEVKILRLGIMICLLDCKTRVRESYMGIMYEAKEASESNWTQLKFLFKKRPT